MAKVLVVASNLGCWGEELQAPWDLLKQAGHTLTLSTYQGKTPLPLAWSVDHDFRDPNHALINVAESVDRTLELVHNGEWDNPIKIDDAKMSDYDAICLIGGFGAPLDINGSPAIHRMLIEAWQADKIMGALCYAVGALALTRKPDNYHESIIRGKTVTAHPHEWDWIWALPYDLYGATPENPGTKVITPGFVYPLRPLVEDALGPEGTCVSPPETTRDTPCAVYDHPFVTALSFESSTYFGQKMVDALAGK